MRKLIYHVATSLDGFISEENGSTNGFVAKGRIVEEYLATLKTYDTVIMGRNTYEFGYLYGLKAGEPAYPQMENYIVSRSLQFETTHPKVHLIRDDVVSAIEELKAKEGTPIYLCGGAQLSGFLLKNDLIDEIIVKLNPFIMGKGKTLFDLDFAINNKLELLESKTYLDGGLLLHYAIF